MSNLIRKKLNTKKLRPSYCLNYIKIESQWRVKQLDYLKSKLEKVQIIIEAKATLSENLSCADDTESMSHYDHSAKRTWRHLNIFDYEYFIECRLPRIKVQQTFDRCPAMANADKAVDQIRQREHRSLCRKGDKSLKGLRSEKVHTI